MSTNRRDIQKRLRARRRRSNAIAVAALGGIFLMLTTLLVVAGWIPVQGDVELYLHGPGIDHLSRGARVAIGVEEVGHVKRIELRDGQALAHLSIDREAARQIPQESRFVVESLNRWMPGNVGLRIYTPRNGAGGPPVRDGMTLESNNRYLAEYPRRFFVLLGAGLFAAAAVVGVAAAFYRLASSVFSALMTLVIGAALLLAAYAYFDAQITRPDPPFDSESNEPQ